MERDRFVPSVELSYRVMLMHLAYSLLISLVLLACGEAASSRTLVTVSYSGTSLDIRRLPKMMAQAAAVSGAARLRYLNPDDQECEKCFAQEGMIYDLTAIGVQIVRSQCSASYNQILNYLKKAKGMLGIDFTCEPDSGFALMPAPNRGKASHHGPSDCTGGNRKLHTNDPISACQSNHEVIRIGAAWRAVRKATRRLRKVVLAIVDSGVEMEHPDLVNQFWKNPADGSIGYDFITNTNKLTDGLGHGTFCAGIAAAQTNNRIGIAGVANADPLELNVELMILRICDEFGWCLLSNELRALDYAVKMNATVSSHSYGAPNTTKAAEKAWEKATATGHLAVVASGNYGDNLDEGYTIYPCQFAKTMPMLCITGSTSSPNTKIFLADFSDAGSFTKVAAPAIDVNSTVPPSTYDSGSGTSASAPTAAGVAAMLATRVQR